MKCTLNKLNIYNVSRVIHNKSNGSYLVKIFNPPAACPDGVFTSKNLEVQVDARSNPSISFDIGKNKPIIMVPTTAYVEETGSSLGFGSLLIIIAGLFLIGTALILLFQRRKVVNVTEQHVHNYGSVGYGSVPVGMANGVVVGSSMGSTDGLVTGMVLGAALSNNHSDRVIERETIIEREVPSHNYSDDSNSNSYSSDDSSSDSSYSSDDSDSSYSSDSSSDSFSSDSSSDSGSGD